MSQQHLYKALPGCSTRGMEKGNYGSGTTVGLGASPDTVHCFSLSPERLEKVLFLPSASTGHPQGLPSAGLPRRASPLQYQGAALEGSALPWKGVLVPKPSGHGRGVPRLSLSIASEGGGHPPVQVPLAPLRWPLQ